MKFIPHDYQRYCIEYIKTHPVSALLLDCGLGKTVISLTAINELIFDELKISKVLVIAPLRVTYVWQAEIEKWEHLHNLDVSLIVGTKRQRITAINQNALIYVVKYALRSYAGRISDEVTLEKIEKAIMAQLGMERSSVKCQ